MGYFVTGATGFIGGRLVEQLLERSGPIYCLVREGSQDKLDARIKEWGTTKRRIKPVVGDLTEPRLGLTKKAIRELKGDVDHIYHLAAIYDLTASEEAQHEVNVEGTRHVVEFANELGSATLHHVSSIAAAGLYDGTFTEEMFAEADAGLEHPYFATKHESEGVVRDEATLPYRIYRPAMVVGDSRTGEIDKIDGPYYVFKLIQRLRGALPPWFPLIGLEGRLINIVPVDFVVAALDHISHLDGEWDGKTFHLVDPEPHTAGEVMNIFARAAHAPTFSMRIDPMATNFIPKGVRKVLGSLPPVENTKKAVLGDLGIPEEVFTYVDWPTEFDDTNTRAALLDTDIAAPPLEDYAWRIWDYWERHLDPDLSRDRSLRGAVEGRRVLVTGASGGIGKEIALLAGEAGAHVLLVSRTEEKLQEVADEIEQRGGTGSVYPCDLTDMDDIDRMCKQVLADLDGVDVIVNNAGRSIRRSVRLSLDRFHDYERTMQLNYFGAVKLILDLLPSMLEKGSAGHIINISSIGVQTNTPRFSAYVASKSALDAFSRCIASEIIDDDVHITTVYMPLVRTPMIAPTKMYDYFPALTPREAGQMVCDAMIDRPKRVTTGLGNFGQTLYSISPKLVDQVLHTAYRLFPDSEAAKGEDDDGTAKGKGKGKDEKASPEGVAFAHLLKGVHW